MTIEKKIRVEDFRLLRQRFNRATVDSDHEMKDRTVGKERIFLNLYVIHELIGSLNKEDFIEAFESILDLTQYGYQLEKLFDKVKELFYIKFLNIRFSQAQFERNRID